jgi:DNA-damage-inducible protein J
MAQIQVRIDDTLKKQTQEVLEKLGLNLSTAVKMFCRQIVQVQALPLESRDVNGFSLEKSRRLSSSIKEFNESKKNETIKSYSSAEEMMDDILFEK